MSNIKDLFRLFVGFKAFKEEMSSKDNGEYTKNLSLEQNPKILVIACSDSRVDPAILTQANLGDMFVIRNVANIVPPYQKDNTTYHGTSAAIEYAVNILQVKHVIVLGHSQCGGIQTLMEKDNEDLIFVKDWVDIIKEAKVKSKKYSVEEKYHVCEKEGIKISLNNLKTFPFIADKIEDSSLLIHGLYFKIDTSDIFYYEEESENFIDVQEALLG